MLGEACQLGPLSNTGRLCSAKGHSSASIPASCKARWALWEGMRRTRGPTISHDSYFLSFVFFKVCYSCLSLLDPTANSITSPLSGRHFCSDACMAAAEASFHALESLGQDPLQAFEAACNENGERFPLMAARLAFMRLTRAVKHSRKPPRPDEQGGRGAEGPHVMGSSGAATPGGHSQGALRGDPVADLGFLCFANVGKPYPDHWIQLYDLLRCECAGVEHCL